MTKKIRVRGPEDTGSIIDASHGDFIAVDPDVADRLGVFREKALSTDDVRKEMENIEDELALAGLADVPPGKIQ